VTINVNGVVVGDARVASAAADLAGEADPLAAARRTLAVRELLLQRAGELGLLEGGAAEAAKAARGDTVRAYGRLLGSVTASGKTVPDIEASLVLPVKAGPK